VMSTFAPRGAQVALRLDLDRLRASSLANEAGELLANLRDVRLLLDGSGVDPLRDLTHLFLASPDLRREHVVMAGRYHGDESVPRTAVDSLAQERGEVASWRDLRGIRVAPWFNRDATARVLALIGPSLFAITREEDLGRVLAVARTLAKRSQRTAAQDDPVQALLNLEKQELMAISVENARTFIQGASAQQIGDRIEISVKQSGNDRFELHLTADYAGANDAKTAETFWQRVKERYANHPLTALIGMADVLRDASLTAHDSSLVGTLSVSSAQARLILRFARDALGTPKLAPMPRADPQPPPLH
jgi:hypothetical protein